MKLLTLNLLYETGERKLIVSELLRPVNKPLCIIIDVTVFGLKELKFARTDAVNYAAENRLGPFPAVLAASEKVSEMLRLQAKFNRTVVLLRSYGHDADPLTGDYYWTGEACERGRYIAVKNRTMDRVPYGGQIPLSFRLSFDLG